MTANAILSLTRDELKLLRMAATAFRQNTYTVRPVTLDSIDEKLWAAGVATGMVESCQ